MSIYYCAHCHNRKDADFDGLEEYQGKEVCDNCWGLILDEKIEQALAMDFSEKEAVTIARMEMRQ